MRRGARKEAGQVTAEYAVGALGVTAIGAGVLLGPEAIVSSWVARFFREAITRSFELSLPDLFGWPW